LLHELPVPFIKLDRTFDSQLHTVSGRTITEHFLSLSRQLHLGVVAEGSRPRERRWCSERRGRASRRDSFTQPTMLEGEHMPAAPLHVCSGGSLLEELAAALSSDLPERLDRG
jgi:predicted signal transduction protein with EAL and GGDEF domain